MTKVYDQYKPVRMNTPSRIENARGNVTLVSGLKSLQLLTQKVTECHRMSLPLESPPEGDDLNRLRCKVYFLVYDDGTCTTDIDRLLLSVDEYHKYPPINIIRYTKKEIDPIFVQKNKQILDMSRGGGYWLWKPYIINETLKKLQENDILIYLDSKYYFTQNFVPMYQEYMMNNDIFIWKNRPNGNIHYMKQLCKMDVVVKYDMYQKVFHENAIDCWAGFQILKKTSNTVSMMEDWLDMCCIYDDITDEPSILPNQPGFYEHRHDQSLLSIVLHKYNIPLNLLGTDFLQDIRNPTIHP